MKRNTVILIAIALVLLGVVYYQRAFGAQYSNLQPADNPVQLTAPLQVQNNMTQELQPTLTRSQVEGFLK